MESKRILSDSLSIQKTHFVSLINSCTKFMPFAYFFSNLSLKFSQCKVHKVKFSYPHSIIESLALMLTLTKIPRERVNLQLMAPSNLDHQKKLQFVPAQICCQWKFTQTSHFKETYHKTPDQVEHWPLCQ